MAGSTSPARRAPRTIRAFVAGVAILVVACGGPAVTPEPTPAPTSTPSITLAPTASAAATQAALATALPTAVPTVPVTEAPTIPPITVPPITEPPVTEPPVVAPAIGVPILIGDQQRMTVLAAEQWAGVSGLKPAKGKVFFTVSIRIDAVAVTSWDSADFKLRDTAGKSFVWRTGRSPHLYDGANMTRGQNYVGWITYEIPKPSLVGLTLIYKPGFLVDTTFKVLVS
jgi:hypothetical protein